MYLETLSFEVIFHLVLEHLKLVLGAAWRPLPWRWRSGSG